MSQHDNLRDNIGQALSDAFKAIGPIDDTDSNDIDQLADVVVAVLASIKNPWYEAVLDQCAITHMPFHEDDPKKTIDGLIDWHVQVALDPLVSETQAALVADRNRINFLEQRAISSCGFSKVNGIYRATQMNFKFDVDLRSNRPLTRREMIDNGMLQV